MCALCARYKQTYMKTLRQIIISQCLITYEVDACEYVAFDFGTTEVGSCAGGSFEVVTCLAGGSEVAASEDDDGEACACEVGGIIL